MNYPIVFSKFENDFTTLGIAVLENANNVKIHEVINGEYTLSFILPPNDPKWAYLQEENFVLVEGQLFRMRTFDNSMDNQGKLASNVQCEHVWYDANDCKHIPNFEMIGATPRQILEAAFSGTRFTIGTVDASLANTDIMLSKTNPAAVINKLVENVGGEVERDNWTIGLRARIGNNNGVQFRVGKNLNSAKMNIDSRGLITRLYPYGVDDLDITSVNPTAYLDSPFIGNYDYIHEGTKDYRDIDDPTELKNKGLAEFSTTEKDGCDKPKVTLTVDIVELTKLGYSFESFRLGDIVRTFVEKLNVDISARIMEYDRYPYEAKKSNVTLANFRNNAGKLIASLADSRNRLNNLTTPEGKVKVAWLENIMAKLQTEITAGLTKKVAMHDYGDVWVDNIENPTKAMAIVNGMFAIANSKKDNGDWAWRTFGNGDGFTADLINAGVIRLADTLYIENDSGTTKLNTTGIEITDPEKARAIFKTGTIALQAWNPITRTWDYGLYFDIATRKFVFDGTLSAAAIEAIKANIDIVISNTVITQNLYAQNGTIADLTVNKIDTSQMVQRFIDHDKSDVNYWKGYDQHIQFITAQYAGDIGGQEKKIQLSDRNNNLIYWTDDTHTGTTLTANAYPVWIYVYDELVKAEITFKNVDGIYIPQIWMGAGTGIGNNGKMCFWKGTTGAYWDYYHSTTGELFRAKITDDGLDFGEVNNITYPTGMTVTGQPQLWVGAGLPANAKQNDVAINTLDPDPFSTTAGHGHDGSDSKKISYTSLIDKPLSFPPTTHASTHITGGTDVIANAVANGNAGLMSGSDKAKLSGISAGSQVNADITKAEIEAKLIGEISSHSHALTKAIIEAVLTGTIISHSHNGTAPIGGTLGQVLKKASATNYDFVWGDPASAINGIPSGGTTNQLLAKNSNTDYDGKWINAPQAANGIPTGGTAGQVLAKVDGTDYNAQWVNSTVGTATDNDWGQL